MISIDELERLEKAATPGPWRGDARGTHCDPAQDTVTVKTSLGNLFKLDKWDAAACANDADLIIETRNALPALIAEVRELRAYKAQVERVKACGACLRGTVLNDFGVPRGGCDKCGGLP